MTSLDWKLSVKLSNNNPKLAKDLLTMFAKDLPSFRQRIIDGFKKSDINELKEATHKLHGACCYCGVPQLKIIVQELEALLQADNISASKKLQPALIKEIDTLTDELKKIDTYV